MSLRIQRKLKFVPLVQIITVFCLIHFYRKNNAKYADVFKSFIKMAGFFLLLNIPRMFIHFVFQNDLLDGVVFYLSIYPFFYGLSSIAVAEQEKYET